MGLIIQKPGLQTTIQDLGRNGYQALGFSVSGPMDSLSMEAANLILQNDRGAATIEMGIVGGHFLFKKDTIISITGAFMNPKINQLAIHQGAPISVRKGDLLTFGPATHGVYTYLAVKDGFKSLRYLSSRSSSNLRNSILGSSLKKEAYIPFETYTPDAPKRWFIDTMIEETGQERVIRYIEGRHYEWFTEEAKQTFENEPFHISSQSNRMGYRLKGVTLKQKQSAEVWTEGTLFGSIQVPPNGQPIILMADRQPTGGYPKIGQVIKADLPKLSQTSFQSKIRFKKVTLMEAFEAYKQQEQLKRVWRVSIERKWKEWCE
ncbi:biotin-dependent carboxyltransferase family protein [Radiobacillus kanasensis]|uniref:5-oxoprolinase subunit C family protein n=1 Tax=Radiobacillus kanasensis TaxID=2844358 RepID=UPI001E37BB75|nr:biotin-dependent carboxyltransferase family protein [Radiobacillus kanasensis]UFT98580.1 biotin-dependent carboxyltransferase family protein [Radiobacillus kanasensis]